MTSLPSSTTPRPTRRGLFAGLAVLGASLTGTAVSGTAAHAEDKPAAVLPTTKTLKRGSKGKTVTALQKRLNALHYYCGAANGTYGPQTAQAVMAVQKVAGLKRDGVAGAKTIAAINKGVQPKRRYTKGTHVEVDIKRQIIMVSKNSKLAWILNTSTGSGKRYGAGLRKRAVTPKGNYSVYRTVKRGWDYGPLGGLYRPVYFKGGYAIHGSTSIPGYPASHGCCRVSTTAMDKLWREGIAKRGVKVHLY